MPFCLHAASTKTVSFYNKAEGGDIQRVTFDSDEVKRMFHGSFHKVNRRSAVRRGGIREPTTPADNHRDIRESKVLPSRICLE